MLADFGQFQKNHRKIHNMNEVRVKEDLKSGELYIELSNELLDEAGLKINDAIEWIDNKNGSWTLRKVQEQQEPHHWSYHTYIAKKYKQPNKE